MYVWWRQVWTINGGSALLLTEPGPGGITSLQFVRPSDSVDEVVDVAHQLLYTVSPIGHKDVFPVEIGKHP